MELGKEYFGPLWSFVASNEITDIDYNGKEIWLTNIFNERFRANQQFVTQYMTPAFGKIRFISEKYYGKNKAGGLMENSRWLNDPEFNSLLRQALAI